jgi:hypothetical protein
MKRVATLLKDLGEMMLQVPYVILNQKTKRHRLIFAYNAAVVSLFLGNMKYYMEQVAVKPGPELNKIVPGFGLVSLRFDPLGLRIARKRDLAGELSPDDPLMVVRCRVDEMAKNLFPRPFAGSQMFFALSLADLCQPRQRVVQNPLKMS